MVLFRTLVLVATLAVVPDPFVEAIANNQEADKKVEILQNYSVLSVFNASGLIEYLDRLRRLPPHLAAAKQVAASLDEINSSTQSIIDILDRNRQLPTTSTSKPGFEEETSTPGEDPLGVKTDEAAEGSSTERVFRDSSAVLQPPTPSSETIPDRRGVEEENDAEGSGTEVVSQDSLTVLQPSTPVANKASSEALDRRGVGEEKDAMDSSAEGVSRDSFTVLQPSTPSTGKTSSETLDRREIEEENDAKVSSTKRVYQDSSTVLQPSTPSTGKPSSETLDRRVIDEEEDARSSSPVSEHSSTVWQPSTSLAAETSSGTIDGTSFDDEKDVDDVAGGFVDIPAPDASERPSGMTDGTEIDEEIAVTDSVPEDLQPVLSSPTPLPDRTRVKDEEFVVESPSKGKTTIDRESDSFDDQSPMIPESEDDDDEPLSEGSFYTSQPSTDLPSPAAAEAKAAGTSSKANLTIVIVEEETSNETIYPNVEVGVAVGVAFGVVVVIVAIGCFLSFALCGRRSAQRANGKKNPVVRFFERRNVYATMEDNAGTGGVSKHFRKPGPPVILPNEYNVYTQKDCAAARGGSHHVIVFENSSASDGSRMSQTPSGSGSEQVTVL